MAIRPASRPQRPLSALSTLLGVRLDPVTAVGHSHSPNDLGFLSGLTLDSRSVKPGDLYVALPGAHVHGAAFCADAVAAGAVAVLTDPDGRAPATASGVPVFLLADPRARLGEIVFSDDALREKLNAIVHPLVSERMLSAERSAYRYSVHIATSLCLEYVYVTE